MSARVQAYVSDDPREAWGAVRPFLEADPVAHNVVLSLLAPLVAADAGARQDGWYGWAVGDGDEVVGAAVQCPRFLPVNVTTMPAGAANALAEALAARVPDLPGVRGEVAAAAGVAGAWAEHRAVPVTPVEGERLYGLGELDATAALDVPGGPRPATEDDLDAVTRFVTGFIADTGAHDPQGEPTAAAAALVATGRVVLWCGEDGTPQAMAHTRPPVGGAGRVGRVFTPPEHRRRGLGGAVTVAATQRLLDEGTTAVLLTQLGNPTSNALYRRLGYRVVHERLHYRFG